jgi:DNA-binding CsgD family transcriptional regulator
VIDSGRDRLEGYRARILELATSSRTGEEVRSLEPGTVWRALVEGRASLMDRFSAAKHWFFTARTVVDGRKRPLSRRERDIAERLASPDPMKLVGASLGIGASTASRYASDVVRKLRLRSRLEVLMFARALPPRDREWSCVFDDETLLVLQSARDTVLPDHPTWRGASARSNARSPRWPSRAPRIARSPTGAAAPNAPPAITSRTCSASSASPRAGS